MDMNIVNDSAHSALVITLITSGAFAALFGYLTVKALVTGVAVAPGDRDGWKRWGGAVPFIVCQLLAAAVGIKTAMVLDARQFLREDDVDTWGYASADVAARWLFADYASGCRALPPGERELGHPGGGACLDALAIATKGEFVPYTVSGDTLRIRIGDWPFAKVVEAPRPERAN